MRVGLITMDGQPCGWIGWTEGNEQPDTFTPDLKGYEPLGRADDGMGAAGRGSGPAHAPHHGAPHHGRSHHHSSRHHEPEHKDKSEDQGPPRRDRAGGEGETDPRNDPPKPKFAGGEGDEVVAEAARPKPVAKGPPVRRGSKATEDEIEAAAKRHHLDPNTMKGIASIESDMNPSAGARGSHKGLFQISGDEWNRFAKPGENILSAKDNAAVAGRLFEANRAAFRKAMGRDPTDKELYMMHQQGMGHFTRGALTNVHGNRYPGMHGAQTPESFREGWGRELARRKAQFENPGAATAPQASTSPTSAPPAVAPGAVNAPNGQAPQKLIIHHTGGRGGPQGVRDTLAQRGLGVQYIVDRDGNVVEGGGNKRSHIKDGWGPGAGLSNSNTVGFEVIAKDDKDVTAAQIEGVKRFVEKYYPNTPVMGHGQANPGHKEADEGKTIVDAINAERAKRSTAAQ